MPEINITEPTLEEQIDVVEQIAEDLEASYKDADGNIDSVLIIKELACLDAAANSLKKYQRGERYAKN